LGMAKAQESGVHFLSVLGIVVLLCAVFGIFYLYFRNFAKEYLENSSILLMVAIIMVLTLLLSSVGIVKDINPYILPLAVGTALLAVLLDVRFALLYNTLMSVLGVLIFKGDAYCLICLLASGAFSAFIFTRGGVRHTLVFSALLQVILCGLLYFGVGVLEGVGNGAALLRGVYGLAAGGLTSVFVIGTLPIWEYAFDVTTPYKLLDLANPEQKLLKRLLIEAPGTYHHSLMVGNLAEAACEATGGNGLLAKIGAYYHDIGKLRRPQYFKENQYAENPHDKITPILSASIIISHVKDGVEMARQNRLPAAICGIIASHHGNSKVAFFYHKATIESEGEVEEAKFHYDGVLPHTKEEAIVMLADSVEAAVRSLSEKTEKEIREMVHKIVQGKLSDGQLMESGLTLQDIDSAENAFVRMFCGYFHSRIQYPEMKDTEKKTE
ncbi:MAG: HDIG domain-containing protein, partial [Clostridia bacterium]|nr:HDIG domain-containing protein [Clostridia bacterium]